MEFVRGFCGINIVVQGPASGRHVAAGNFDRACLVQGANHVWFQTTHMLVLSILIPPDMRNSVGEFLSFRFLNCS